jgi:uncharacterized protein YecE (DUF72 family)
MLRVGCVGFPIGRDRYWRSLSFVEARTGEAMPRPETLAEWKAGAPRGAEFAVQAYRLITHGPDDRGFPPAGRRLTPFRRAEVGEAWGATRRAAEVLGARLVVFETPASFLPGADGTRDMYKFFRGVSRAGLSLVWHPRGAWEPALADRVCADLGLIRAFDPLRENAPASGAVRYLRPLGPRMGTWSVDKLSMIVEAGRDKPSYLALSHRDGFRDAEKLVDPRAAR